MRKIANPEVVEAIWKKTRGHPLDLTLFGDIVANNPTISSREVRRLPQQYARLIERIIDRIPDEQSSLRWLLRYAVVPRRLDLGYIHHVINIPVMRESQGTPVLDDTKRYPDPRAQQRYGKQERWHPLDRPRLDEAWEQLRSYAAQTSWVIEDDGAIRLQPEIVEPMRALLRVNPIYKELQRRSQQYFERLGKEHGHEWGQWMEEAIYHRFQRDAPGAGAYWVKQLGKARKRGLSDLEHVAGVVFGPEFLDEERHPFVDIARTSLARASFDLAYAALIKRLRVRTSHSDCDHYESQLAQRWKDLKFYTLGGASHAVSKAKRHLIQAAVIAYLGKEKLQGRALRLAKLAASQLREGRYRLAAEMLLASRIYWPNLKKAKPHFTEAIRLARRRGSVDLPSPLLNFLLGRLYLYADDLEGAVIHFERSSLDLSDLQSAADLDPAAIFRRTAETLYEAGAWREALALQQRARPATEQRPHMQFQWLHAEARLRLRLGDFDDGLMACVRAAKIAPDLQTKGVQAELAAEIEASRCCIEEGTRLFDQATATYQAAGSYLGIATCRLKMARMYLEGLGNATRALELTASVDRTLWTPELQMELFYLRVRALGQMNSKEAARIWRQDLQTIQKRRFSSRSQARFLVLGLALGFEGREHLQELWPLLAKIRPVTAVYGILNGFALFSGYPPAEPQSVRLERYKPRVSVKSPASVLSVIAYSHALRYLGESKQAAAILDRISGAIKLFPGLERSMREARFKADPHSYVLKPFPTGADRRRNVASDPHRLRFIEEAERAALVPNPPKASEWLNMSSHSEWPEWLERSHWGVRVHLLSAQLEGLRAREGRRHLTSAEDTSREIGYPLPAWAHEALVSIHRQALSGAELAPEAVRVNLKGGSGDQVTAEWHRPDDQSGTLQIGRTFDTETQITHSLRAESGFVESLLGPRRLPVQLSIKSRQLSAGDCPVDRRN